MPLGGVATPGVYGTESQVVQVDMRCPTIESVTACRPDVVVRLEDKRETYLMDVACPWEGGVEKREREKHLKYRNWQLTWQDTGGERSRWSPW